MSNAALLVEDNQSHVELISDEIESALTGWTLDVATTLAEARRRMAARRYDLFLLDFRLPDGDGIELLKKIRQTRNAVPVIAVTARDGVDDRVAGLNLGADDYVVKPFATEELVARMRAVLRRPAETLGLRLNCGNIELDPASGSVAVEGRAVIVPRKELAVLEMLMRRAGRVVARSALEQSVYSLGEEIGSNAMDANISRLRRRLTDAGATATVHAVRGVGYMIGATPGRGGA